MIIYNYPKFVLTYQLDSTQCQPLLHIILTVTTQEPLKVQWNHVHLKPFFNTFSKLNFQHL